jgi:lipid-A-disaccharide synthase
VGHPVIERRARMTGGEALRARLGIGADRPLLALLPGSRSSEIRFIFPIFRAAAEILSREIPGLVTVLPTVPHVAARVREAAAGWPTPLHVLENEDDKYAAFDAADAALAASGTVTAELALSRTPMVVAYRVGGLTYALANRLMTAAYMTLVNILLERRAIPEFKQYDATPEVLAAEVARLFADDAARAAQLDAMNEFGRRLGEGEEAPSQRAARVLLDLIA